jgi:tetratricopeptide (TPR) repeat protein
MSRSSAHRPLILFPALLLVLLYSPAGYGATAGDVAAKRAAAQSLLETGDVDAALEILDNLVKRGSRDGEALLLRSTAHFMNGDISRGRSDLDRALKVDPTLRQAWLNRAALDISEKRLEPALEALARARDLDPSASDNEINIGAVLLLMGRVDEADRSFERYLIENPDSAEAHYLVASNYAMADRADRAVSELGKATALDELSRLRARTDPNFAALAGDPGFQRLLATDGFRPAPGSLRASRLFDLPYEGPESLLLATVLEVIQLANRPIAPRVEVTARWALVWTEVRIKVDTAADGKGQVSLTAPPRSFTAEGWRSLTDNLLSSVTARLHAKRLTLKPGPGRG